MEVIFPKGAKQFVQAFKHVAATTKAVCIYASATRGLWLQAPSDDRTLYHALVVCPEDLLIKPLNAAAGAPELYKAGVQCKSVVAAMRAVTTLADVLVLRFEGDALRVIAKTRKEETDVRVPCENLRECVLDTAARPRECLLTDCETDTKAMEDALKACASDTVVCLDDQLRVLQQGNPRAQQFRASILQHCCRSAIGKSVNVSLYKEHPVGFVYKLLKGSSLAVYGVPSM